MQEAPHVIQKSSSVLALRKVTRTYSCTYGHTHIQLSLGMTTTCCFTFPDISSKLFSIYHHALATKPFLTSPQSPPWFVCLTYLYFYLSFCLSFHLSIFFFFSLDENHFFYPPLPVVLLPYLFLTQTR